MAFASAQVVVGTAPTLLMPTADNDKVAGSSLKVKNPSSSLMSIFVGGPGVTAATGYEIASGAPTETWTDLPPGTLLYAVTATGSVTVGVLQAGV